MAAPDPFIQLDPLVRQLLSESTRQPARQPIPPEQADDILSRALAGVMSGVQYVGETLDKPGRTVRSLLFDESGGFDPGGAQWSDLAHLIPFGDTLGLANPDDAPSPSAIREHYGLTAETGNPWIDVPTNLATDVAIGAGLDPFTLLVGPGKALTRTGVEALEAGSRVGKALSFSDEIAQAGKNAMLGTSPARYADEIRAGQRGLVGLKIPFMEHPFVTFGAGSEKAAAAADALNYSPLSPVPYVRQLFDTRVRGQAPWAQRASDLLHSKTLETSAEIIDKSLAIDKRIMDLSDEYDHTLKVFLENNPQAAQALTGGAPLDQMAPGSLVRSIAELKANGQSMQQIVRDASQLAGTQAPDAVLEAARKFDEVAAAAIQTKDQVFNLYRSYGGDVAVLDDEFINHFPRRLSELMATKMGKGKANKLAKEVWGAIQRNIRDIDGGTYKVNAMSMDPRVTGWWDATDPALRDDMLKQAEAVLANEYGLPIAKELGFDADGNPIIQNVAREFAGYLAQLPPEVTAEGMFSRSLTTDLMDYSLNMMRRANGLQAVHGLTLSVASDDVAIGPTVAELFQDMKINDTGLAKFVNDYAAARGLNPADVNPAELYVPHAMSKAAERMMHYNTRPADTASILKAYDKALGFTKGALYAPWIASHTRNWISGMWQNMVTAWRNPTDAASALVEARNVMRGKGNREWLEAFKAYALHQGLQIDDWLGVQKAQASDIPTGLAGTFREALGEYTIGTAKNLLHPIKTAKNIVAESGSDLGVFKGGRKISELVEFINRYSHFAALKKRGWTNAAAARSVKLAHFDYADLTPFEQEGMKRLVPFYCVPEDSEALTRDGWKNHRELEFGDEMLTYNVDKDCMEWQPCLEVATFEHDQDLMVLENTRHKLRFTPNHRWPVRQSGAKITHPYGTYEYPERRKVVTGEELTTNLSLIAAAEFVDNSESILTPEQSRLLGWLVTDGYHRHRGNHTEAVIYQHPSKFLDEVTSIAGGKPRAPHPDSGVVCVPVLKDRVNEIKPYLNKDNLVKVVTRLSRDAAEAMYDAMYKGDGTQPRIHLNKHRGKEYPANKFLAAAHPGVREAFRVLCIMLGKRTSESDRGCYVSDNRYMKVAGCKKSFEHYRGVVWCPRTENGTWVMRQNGTVTITGNTFARKNLPLQLRSLIDEPGGRAAQTIRAINLGREQAREEGGYVPNYLSEGLAVPVGESVDGQRTYAVSSEILPVEEAFNRFSFFGNLPDWKNIAENIGSMGTPFATVPLQEMSGRQWWSHRDIDDLYQTPTDDQNLNFWLANSPAARALSFGRMATDDRKTALQKLINATVGGGRFTTVDIPKWMNIESREVLERMLEPSSAVLQGDYLFAPDPSKLTEEQIIQLSLLQQLQQENRKMNKERKARGQR